MAVASVNRIRRGSGGCARGLASLRWRIGQRAPSGPAAYEAELKRSYLEAVALFMPTASR